MATVLSPPYPGRVFPSFDETLRWSADHAQKVIPPGENWTPILVIGGTILASLLLAWWAISLWKKPQKPSKRNIKTSSGTPSDDSEEESSGDDSDDDSSDDESTNDVIGAIHQNTERPSAPVEAEVASVLPPEPMTTPPSAPPSAHPVAHRTRSRTKTAPPQPGSVVSPLLTRHAE